MFYIINWNYWLKDERVKLRGIMRRTTVLLVLDFFVGLVDSKKCGLTPGLSFNYKIISTQTENIPWKQLWYMLCTSMKHGKTKVNMIMGDHSN